MARVIKKRIREFLEEYAAAQGKLETLRTQRDEAVRPARELFERRVAKIEKEFIEGIAKAQGEVNALEETIQIEMQNGYDAAADAYVEKLIESENAVVEVNTREQREVSPEEWLREVPASEQKGKFFDTINVLITKADKFRSDIVAKLSNPKRNHSITVRLK